MATSGFQVSGSAPEAYERFVRVIMHPFVEAVVEQAAVRPGDAVLDVACGPGFVARRLAPSVGETGRMVGADINAGMLAAARAASAGSPVPIEWIECSALEIPLDDGSFDAIVCQQGLQFFPDRPKAIAELARLLASGGRLVATFWSPLSEQPFFGPQMTVLDQLLGAEAAELASQAFTLSPAVVEQELAAAGFNEVRVQTVREQIALPPLAEFLPGQVQALPVGPALVALRDGQQRYLDAMVSALSEYVRPDGSALVPFASYLVAARR